MSRPKGSKTTSPTAKKTGPKLAVTERLDIKAEVAKLSRRGASTRKIAEKVGLSQPQIQIYVTELREQYRNTAIKEKAEHVAECLDALKEIRDEAWEQWEQSKQNLVRKITEEGENGMGFFTKEQLIEEGRLAYKAYMDVVLETWDKEMELTGHKPQPQKAGDTNINFTNVDWSSMSAKPPVQDPLKERVKLLDAPKHVEFPNTVDEQVPIVEDVSPTSDAGGRA